jgi:hypothetical protein
MDRWLLLLRRIAFAPTAAIGVLILADTLVECAADDIVVDCE